MSDQWFYVKGGQQVGPISQEQLRALIANGTILPNDMVWSEGFTEWVPASSLPPAGQMSSIGSQGAPIAGQPTRPTSVTVIAIISIILGSLGVLGGICGLVAMLGVGQMQTANQPIALPHGWLVFTYLLSIPLSALLLASGIAALGLTSWARKGLLVYAVAGLLFQIVNTVISVAYMSEPSSFVVGLTIGSFVIGLIFPICILYFMTRPHVVTAFEQGKYRM